MAEEQELDIQTARAVVEIPVNAVTGELTFTIFDDKELKVVKTELSITEIRQALEYGKQVMLDDDIYELTEKGKAMANSPDGW